MDICVHGVGNSNCKKTVAFFQGTIQNGEGIVHGVSSNVVEQFKADISALERLVYVSFRS